MGVPEIAAPRPSGWAWRRQRCRPLPGTYRPFVILLRPQMAAAINYMFIHPRKEDPAAGGACSRQSISAVSTERPSFRDLWSRCWACRVRATVSEPPGEMCARAKRHTESPEMVMTMFCYLCAVFFACLLKRGVTVSEKDPNKALLIRPGMFLSGKRKTLSLSKAAFPPKKHICLKTGLSICESTFRLFAQIPCLCRSSPEKGDWYKAAVCCWKEVNFIRSTQMCVPNVTQHCFL